MPAEVPEAGTGVTTLGLFGGRVSGCEACVVADVESQADLEESVVLWKANIGSRILQKLHERGTWNQSGVVRKLASCAASLGRVCE